MSQLIDNQWWLLIVTLITVGLDADILVECILIIFITFACVHCGCFIPFICLSKILLRVFEYAIVHTFF